MVPLFCAKTDAGAYGVNAAIRVFNNGVVVIADDVGVVASATIKPRAASALSAVKGIIALVAIGVGAIALPPTRM